MERWWFVAFAFASMSNLASAIPIDNGVTGQPEILCLQDSMRILLNTKKPFNGHVYVKGMFLSNPNCHLDLTRTLSHDPKAVFNIPYRSCTTTRERSLSPPGLSYSAIIIIQFHHLFITKVDRAYRLTCFYMESEKIVTAGIHVSMIPSTELADTRPMPSCRYEVLAGTLNGPLVRFAKVGDKVYHKWSCDSGAHGMLVHSCVARDGAGSAYELIDANGCAVDPIALGDLTYSNDLTMAFTQVHVFKFADQMVVNFQCQITLCIHQDSGCHGLSPPRCPGLPTGPHQPQPPNYVNPNPPPGPPPSPFPDRREQGPPPYPQPAEFAPQPDQRPPPFNQREGPAEFVPHPDEREPPFDHREGPIDTVGLDGRPLIPSPFDARGLPPPARGAPHDPRQPLPLPVPAPLPVGPSERFPPPPPGGPPFPAPGEQFPPPTIQDRPPPPIQLPPSQVGSVPRPDMYPPPPRLPGPQNQLQVFPPTGGAVPPELAGNGFPGVGPGGISSGQPFPGNLQRRRPNDAASTMYPPPRGTTMYPPMPRDAGIPPLSQSQGRRQPSQRLEQAEDPATIDSELFAGVERFATFRPPLPQVRRGLQKRDVPALGQAVVEGTLDVTSDDMIVFNLDDSFPQSFTSPNGSQRQSRPPGLPPRFLPVPVTSGEEVCMARLVLIQIIAGLLLFFSSLTTVVAFLQRRYYLNRLDRRRKTGSSSSGYT